MENSLANRKVLRVCSVGGYDGGRISIFRYETYLIPGETLIPGEGGKGEYRKKK